MSTQPRRLSVGTLRPRDVVLEIDGVEYEMRGDIPIEGMIKLLQIHKRMDGLVGGVDDAEEAFKAIQEANELIVSMIKERNPDAQLRVLGITEVMGVLSFLTDNEGGPMAEVEEALVAGVPPPTEAEIEARIAQAVERDRMVREGLIEDVPPTTPSRYDSSTHSSASGSDTTSAPNGGSESPGEPSLPTATEPIAP